MKNSYKGGGNTINALPHPQGEGERTTAVGGFVRSCGNRRLLGWFIGARQPPRRAGMSKTQRIFPPPPGPGTKSGRKTKPSWAGVRASAIAVMLLPACGLGEEHHGDCAR